MSSEAPQVTVLIDNYNYARYLGQAIESALKQDFPRERYEVIVVDDGSRDKSEEVARGFAAQGVRWLPRPHGGQSAALNAGIRASRGAYIALLDADDFWYPSKLSRCVAALETDRSALFVQHLVKTVDDSGEAHERGIYPAAPSSQQIVSIDDFLSGRAVFSTTSAFVFRRSALDAVVPIPEELTYSADAYMYPHALVFGPMIHLSEVLGAYRIHGTNRSAQLTTDVSKLVEHLRFLHAAESHLEKRLSRAGKRWSPELERRRARERLKREVVLSRLEGRWKESLQAYGEVARLDGFSPRGIVQSLTLSLALASPGSYLRLMRWYGGR